MKGIMTMLHELCGDETTINALKASIGKKIIAVKVDNNQLVIEFEEKRLVIKDDGQCCCESRYMSCDDDFTPHIGAEIVDFELKDGPITEDEWGEMHEIQFFEVKTTRGAFQVVNHNEHNGYYGGFAVYARLEDK
jgi:hypothetical protein